jgi:hypothetical protein
MVDIKRFLTKKEAKLADVKKVNEQVYIEEKVFDKETGKEKPSEVEFVDIKKLLRKKASYQKMIDEIDSFIAVISTKYKTYISSLNKE